jgi:hypothetical protein
MPDESLDAGDARTRAAVRAASRETLAAHRDVLFAAVPPDVWRGVIETACDDAMAGDDRARDWIQRLLGIAGAAREEALVSAIVDGASFSQMLDDVAEYRAAAVGIAPAPSPRRPPRARPEASEGPPTYWSVVFQVVTPNRWRAIVDVALLQADDGDPRAREWLGRVLGAEDAAGQIGRVASHPAARGWQALADQWVRDAERKKQDD